MFRFWLSLFVLAAIAVLSADCPLSAQEKQEETYSISLLQAAEADKEVKEVDGQKVLTESYKVKPGDHLWRILREKGLLKKRSLEELLHLLKRLNVSLTNLDLLHPGETIVIPLVVSPLTDRQPPAPKPQAPPVPLEELKELDLELYTIQPGDSVIKVVKRRYSVADKQIHDEYLDLLKRMNPSIENIHRVFPGQKIRLPIFSPQVVRMDLPAPPAAEAGAEKASEPPPELIRGTAGVFKAMGMDWLEAGQHFIPLKAGGQINLNADSFPILSLPHGRRVIVDFKGGLPERMAGLITSNWEDYRIVRLDPGDGLRESIDRILAACGFPKVYRGDQPLELPGEVSVRLRADWVIRKAEEESSGQGRYVALTLVNPGSERTPALVRTLLEEMGIRFVEYPPGRDPLEPSPPRAETLQVGNSAPEIVETILRLSGVSFSRDAEIPVYQSRKSEFNLLVKADFLLSDGGGVRIIDLTGLGPEIVSLLKDHQFPVLRLDEQPDPSGLVSSVLEFSGVPFESKPHSFPAARGEGSGDITITVPGITFAAREGQRILVPARPLPETLKTFLSEKGYKILEIAAGP